MKARQAHLGVSQRVNRSIMCFVRVEQVGFIGARAAAVGRARGNSARAAQRVQGASRRQRLHLGPHYQRAAQPRRLGERGRRGPRGHRRRADVRLEGPLQDLLRVRADWDSNSHSNAATTRSHLHFWRALSPSLAISLPPPANSRVASSEEPTVGLSIAQ